MAGERETSPKNKQILKRLLADPGNKTCADCKTATHPRWASWNLGIFLCIRCSGVHRSLGTHISKVRSVDLDSWTDMHLEQMIKWGNRKANMYWESKLGPNYVPDSSKIVNFIKTKYDLKRWVSGPVLPDPASLDSVPNASEDIPLSQVKQTLAPTPFGNTVQSIDLLGPYDTNAKPARSAPATVSTTSSLLDLDSPISAFVPIQSPETSTNHASHLGPRSHVATSKTGPLLTNPRAAHSGHNPQGIISESISTVSMNSPQASSGTLPSQRVDLKKSILSLYAQKPNSFPQTVHTSQPPAIKQTSLAASSASIDLTDIQNGNWANPSKESQASSIVDSLAGLSFQHLDIPSSSSGSNNPNDARLSTQKSMFADSVVHVEADKLSVTSEENSAVVPGSEDSDIFANVWK